MANILSLRRLRYFAAIAEQGSLSAAARALHIAQPALSHHVGELERGFGTPLLIRHSQGVSLTEAGVALRRHALAIESQVEQAEVEVRALGGSRTVPVRLAVISSIAADLTPVLLQSIAPAFPGIVLRITESGTLNSRDLLAAASADLAISLSADGAEPPLAWERLYWVNAAAQALPSNPVALAEVVHQPLVLPARPNPLRELLERAASGICARLRVIQEIDGPRLRLNAIRASSGSTILGAHSIVGSDRAQGLSIHPISDSAMLRPLFLAARRGLDPEFVRRVRVVVADALASLGSFERVWKPDLR